MVTDVWFGITVGSSRGLVGSEGQWAAGRGAEVQRGRHGPGDPLGDLLLAHGRTPLDVLSNECVLPCPTRMRRPGFTVVRLAAETRVVPENYLTRCPTSSSQSDRSRSRSSQRARAVISRSTATVMALLNAWSWWTARTRRTPALWSAWASSFPTSRSPYRMGRA